MKKFIVWFAGFFEDQKHNASRKAAALYIFTGFFGLMVKGSLEGKKILADLYNIDSMIPTTSKEYQPVRDATKAIDIK